MENNRLLVGASIVDLATGEVETRAWEKNGRSLRSTQVGDSSIVLGDRNYVGIWDLETMKVSYPFVTGHFTDFSVSHDGQWLAIGYEDGSVRIWNISSGQLLAKIKGNRSQIDALSFHPKEQALAAACRDGKLFVWNLNAYLGGKPQEDELEEKTDVVGGIPSSSTSSTNGPNPLLETPKVHRSEVNRFSAEPIDSPQSTKESFPLDGTWQLTSMRRGRGQPNQLDMIYRFSKNKCELFIGKKNKLYAEYDVKTDISKTPSRLTLTTQKDGKQIVDKLIFDVNGDQLRLAEIVGRNQEFPVNFIDLSNSQFRLSHLRRIAGLPKTTATLAGETVKEIKYDTSNLKVPEAFNFELIGVAGYKSSSATKINNAGVILGTCGEGSTSRACMLQDGEFRKLSDFDQEGSVALALSDRGEVAGFQIHNSRSRGFLFNGEFLRLEMDVAHAQWFPRDLNNHRQIVGTSYLPMNGQIGCIWEENRIVMLPSLGGGQSEVRAINDKGQIAGRSNFKRNHPMRACIWSDGKPIDIGTLGEGTARTGRFSSQARDINEQGNTVGLSHI